MKKIIMVCGLIAGSIVTVMMVISTSICYRTGEFEGSVVVGYATMLIAFSLIFVGIKNYRDKYNSGVISFGKAFRIGLYISLIASTMYVIAWLIDYYFFVPDFLDKYAAHIIRETKADGGSESEISNKISEMADFKKMYKNPLMVVLITYSEILPLGLVISLISALLLKRKVKGDVQPI